MKYYSTRNKNDDVNFAAAALRGLAPDGGLYIPAFIPELRPSVKSSLNTMSFREIAYEIMAPWVTPDIEGTVLQDIIESCYHFSPEIAEAGERHVLELFHGPTAAFKDFGARFMARAFSYLRRGEDRPLKILVATSGDTGGAVADGFYGIEGISVTILYPNDRVSPLQERQIAGLGGNITALAVEGSFDDCQALVKKAFSNENLQKRFALSSANSINICRLIPQMTYYAYASGRLPGAIISVPSGNFGNLNAGLYAKKMGADIRQFIAATNINKTIPDYLESGEYRAMKSLPTLSNAMDVGAPSNFERISAYFSLEEMRALIQGVSISDSDTKKTILDVFSKFGYALDPHTAVGWRAADYSKGKSSEKSPIIIAGTAHPGKFAETIEPIIGPVPLPDSLKRAMERKVERKIIPNDINNLMERL
ncbi:MAG: threonine synthase [Treponema sp.]|nr:threonine synthase [Treponema sp.]